ncbi:hypothetical protein Pmani_032318 [Petrolisthes manimaculis]|uniref:Hexosyltransferase n=1 Tax=Petrolisthes manimaculis TaxID=1843537 RepID=A0AAE1NRY4_9EUCA|nr:hypothetical protein Pmani_032318 [Petrolisthes manimaculis]
MEVKKSLHEIKIKSIGSLPSKKLVVGVISARDHFSHREIIRKTWGLQVQSAPDMELFFVVGDDCSVHPDDRISPYACEKLQRKDIDEYEMLSFFKSKQVEYLSNLHSAEGLECYIGLGFRVIHPVILKTLSVRVDLFQHLLESGGMKIQREDSPEYSAEVHIMLWDPEEMIESMQVTNEPYSKSDNNMYYNYRLSSPLFLPAGFEGELKLSKLITNASFCLGDDFSSEPKTHWVCDWRNYSLLEYKFFRTNSNFIIPWRDKYCLMISAEFTVADRQLLLNHEKEEIKRNQEWELKMNDTTKAIEREWETYGDLMELSMVDVYGHLPYKVLGFLKWASHDYIASYILKVDDDTYVNVELIKKLISSDAVDITEGDLAWWSVFHYHRSVPIYGKWADPAYPALVYPAFPAGAGYLMTGNLAYQVSTLHGRVTTTRGEDVSMGIWVTAVACDTRQVNVPCWLPHPTCIQSVLVPQLSIRKIKEMWTTQIHLA